MPGSPTEALRPAELLDALGAACGVLEDHAAALDRLERGDDLPPEDGAAPGPGTDLARTLDAARRRAEGRRDFASLAAELAAGAAEAAVGRSGRRIAAWFAGSAEVLRTTDRLDGPRLALVLEAGAEHLTSGADALRPGCLGSVTAAAADGALGAADTGAPLAEVLIAAADAGLAELERGPQADERLARRGAVDATAAGFLLLLDCLAAVVTGEPLPTPPPDEPVQRAGTAHRYAVSGWVEPESDCGPDEALHLRSLWEELGDVERFDERSGRWDFELVTPRPGAAVEAVWDVGRPRELAIALAPSDVAEAGGGR
jgi:dihydroxyacetone kinase-like predicted kinase